MSYVYICVLFLSVRLSNDSCSYHKRPFSELRRNAANNSLLGVAGLGEEQPARFIGRLGPGKMAAHSINLSPGGFHVVAGSTGAQDPCFQIGDPLVEFGQLVAILHRAAVATFVIERVTGPFRIAHFLALTRAGRFDGSAGSGIHSNRVIVR